MNNKGSARDIVFIAATVFLLTLGFLMAYYGVNTLNQNLLNNSQFNQSAGVVSVLEKTESNLNMLDYFILLIFIGLILGLIVTSLLIEVDTIFTIFYILVLLIATVLSGILSYVWGLVIDKEPFISVVVNFPISNFLLNNLAYFIVAAGFIGMVLLYAKNRNQIG